MSRGFTKKFFKKFFKKGLTNDSGYDIIVSERGKEHTEMTTYTIINYNFHDKEGINKEQCLDYHLNGRHGKHDNLKWNEGSDIPEQKMSVKSAKFSLCAGGQLQGNDINEMITDFFNRVASTVFAYVTKNYEVYEMNATEFKEFLEQFGYLSYESGHHDKIKIKAKSESKMMIEWFKTRVA